ncbi:MAG: hypothetical protein PHY12_15090 [Eubacteriales bacterium]|nr:hypothetical protein [Eubacteriales bacterium]
MKALWERLRSRPLLLVMGIVVAALLWMAFSQGQSTGASHEEKRIADVLSAMSGAGRVEVALYYEQADGLSGQSKPCGAVAVAQGADDMQVRLRLIRALRTLLGLPENAVDVFAMKEEP